MSAEEVARAISEPIVKLIDVCSQGVGRVYEPTHIKRIAKAIRENSDLPIKYNSGHISIDGSSMDEIEKRMQNRLYYQEMKKQRNIENVIAESYLQLKFEPEVSSKSVDADWITRFFNSVEGVNNEQMQLLWSALLSGEIKKPGSYSLRTLDTLRNITEDEAKVFRKIVPFIVHDNHDCSFLQYKLIWDHFNISFSNILSLIDVGLINPMSSLVYEIEFYKDKQTTAFMYGTKALIFNHNIGNKETLCLPAYKLTKVGQELLSLTEEPFCQEYIEMLSKELLKDEISLSYCDVFDIHDGKLEYDVTDVIEI